MNPFYATIDQVFILRFWREIGDHGDEFRWRVKVRNVETRQSQITDDIESAFALVEAQLNACRGP